MALYPQIRSFLNWDTHTWVIHVSKPLLQPCDDFERRWDYRSPALPLSEFYKFLQSYAPSLYVEADVEPILEIIDSDEYENEDY